MVDTPRQADIGTGCLEERTARASLRPRVNSTEEKVPVSSSSFHWEVGVGGLASSPPQVI